MKIFLDRAVEVNLNPQNILLPSSTYYSKDGVIIESGLVVEYQVKDPVVCKFLNYNHGSIFSFCRTEKNLENCKTKFTLSYLPIQIVLDIQIGLGIQIYA